MSPGTINIVEGPRFDHVFGTPRTGAGFAVPGRDFAFTGSGKAALAVILQYLRAQGALESKNAPVLMPPWMGIQVYQAAQTAAFPQLRPAGDERVILAYHQFGFPQDMDRLIDYSTSRKAIVIEDCAHGPESSYRGRQVGSFGDYAIYSFSKFLFCYALGGIAYAAPEFGAYLRERTQAASASLTRALCLFKLADEHNLARKRRYMPAAFTAARKAAYALYPDALWPLARGVRLWNANHRRELDLRKERYRTFRAMFDNSGICAHLESDGVTPWVIPIKVKDEESAPLLERLRDMNVETGIYRFDMNRFMIEPRYEPVVIIPCHGAIDDTTFERITNAIRHTIRHGG